MKELLDNDVAFLPATVDAHMMEGPALQWFRTGNGKQFFDTTFHFFGRAKGAQEEIEMCRRTMQDHHMKGVLRRADTTWKQRHGTKRLFGSSYEDPTPSRWSAVFLSINYAQVFSKHIMHCKHRNNQFLKGYSNKPSYVSTLDRKPSGACNDPISLLQ